MTSDLSPLNKLRLVAMVLGQPLVDWYDLHTTVEPLPGGEQVRHRTVFAKWGICFLYSEKMFALDPDGIHLSLTGQEHYWPRFGKASVFGPLPGQIEASGVEAIYQMPLLNLPCEFRTLLDGESGWIQLNAGWLTGDIRLTAASMGQLRARFREEGQSADLKRAGS